MKEDIQIEVRNVSKQYHLYNAKSGMVFSALIPFLRKNYKRFTALDDVSFEVTKGEIVGIIGRNGSGKSTLLRIIAGISAPTSGTVEVKGKLIPLFELGTGFHQELTGRENLYYFTLLQNFDKHKSARVIEEAIAFADIGDFIDQPLRIYSRGMKSRLSFAISIYVEADILIIDEALAVGDAAFKEKSYEKFHELITSGKTILLVTHSEKEIENVCTRAILLHQGKIMMDGVPAEVVEAYRVMSGKQSRKGNGKKNKHEDTDYTEKKNKHGDTETHREARSKNYF